MHTRTLITAVSAAFILAAVPARAGSLIEAVRSADYAEMSKLIKAGANLNESDWLYTDEMTPLIAAANQTDAKAVRMLIDGKADVSFRTPSQKRSALMYLAAHSGLDEAPMLEIMTMLLKAGARVNDRDDSGKTAVMLAVEYNNARPAILKLLLQYKPDLSLKDGSGNSALYVAALNGYADSARLLLAAGANPNQMKQENKFITAPIHYAAENGHIEFVKAVLDAKGDVNIRTAGGFAGMTPLHKAVEARDVEMVKLILRYKPDLTVRDSGGFTALDYAHHGGGDELSEIIGLLEKAGAK